MSIEEVLKLACTTSDGLISRISTVRNLAMYLSSRSELDGENYLKCKEDNEEALTRLIEVIGASEDNLCSEEKISLIENYHTDFISTHWQDMIDRKDTNRRLAPQMIAMFFMHYAIEINSICKRNLIPNLVKLTEKIGGQGQLASFANGQDWQRLMKTAFADFNSLSEVKDYDDIILIWDLMSNMLLANDEEIPEDDLDTVTGEPVKLMAKLKSPKLVIELKQKCQSTLRPVYRKVIMPVIRLANLGYDLQHTSNEDLERLRSIDLVRQWYIITQICETILPIKFYQDDDMKEGTIALLSKEEAKKLASKSEDGNLQAVEQSDKLDMELKLKNNVLEDIDLISSVFSMEDQTLLQNHKTNLTARDRIMKRMLAKFTDELKKNIKKIFGKIFFPFNRVGQETKSPTATSGKREPIQMLDLSMMLGESLRDINSKELFESDISGAARNPGKKRRFIEKNRRRQRPFDTTDVQKHHDPILYMHTRSLVDIVSDWRDKFRSLEHSKRELILLGGWVTITLLLCLTSGLVVAASG